MTKKCSPLLVFLCLLLISLMGLSYESVFSIKIQGQSFINFDLWPYSWKGQGLNVTNNNEKQEISSEPLPSPSDDLTTEQVPKLQTPQKQSKIESDREKNVSLKKQHISFTSTTKTSAEGSTDSNYTVLHSSSLSSLYSSSSSSSSSSSTSLSSSSAHKETTTSPPTPPLPDCSSTPSKLQGRFTPLLQDVSLSQVEQELTWVPPGGEWAPESCLGNVQVALIVPFRNRLSQLSIFLRNLHPMLRQTGSPSDFESSKKQNLHYKIYLVNQTDLNPFNRAMLFNVGFTEAMNDHNWNCVIFHDVDLIPEDDRNIYSCATDPRHMSVAVDKFDYKLPYKAIFGGATALTPDQFRKLNGFSNMFWGWGGEDDDMAARVQTHGMRIERYSEEIARYRMLKHSPENPNKMRFSLLKTSDKRFKTDGLTSLEYKLVGRKLEPLFTEIDVALLRTTGDARGHLHSFHRKI